ncbi:MAG: hypothetical protein K2N23_07865 [Clostridia bacterium]|nr:hypothetical protein [Clostridia bacterium]
MKKFVTTAILGILSATCALAFTACGGNSGDSENNKPADPETQWKTALGYFAVDWDYEEYAPIMTNRARINFTCNSTNVSEDDDYSAHGSISMDFDKKATDMNGIMEGYYLWKDGDIYYSTGDSEIKDETGEYVDCYYKATISKDEFDLINEANVFSYAGGMIISELDLVNKYSEFTYSEAKDEYTATLNYEKNSGTCDITIKIKDGKLAFMSANLHSTEYGELGYTFEYTYGTTVTIPDFYLNLALGDTPKPQN